MTYSKALEELKNDNKVTRAAWGDPNVLLFIQHETTEVNENETVTEDVIMMQVDAEGTSVCWPPSQADILADDWEVVA